MPPVTLSPEKRQALGLLAADLRRVFGNRLLSICAYGLEHDPDGDTHTLVLVDRLTFEDLVDCVPLARGWHAQGVEVPLLLEEHEFMRTLDVFPLEYGDILAHHVVIEGTDPFLGLTVSEADLRRACELQAKSHLIHLREGFLESGGDPRAISRLIGASAEGFRRLLENLVSLVRPTTVHVVHSDVAEDAQVFLGVPAELTREVLAKAGAGRSATIADPMALLEQYVAAVDRIWEFVDEWKRA
jgi:hypothetical protein